MDWLAMLQFSIGTGAVLAIGVWILYFTAIRPAIRRQKLQSMGETSAGPQDLAEAEEVRILATFRVLPNERRKIAVRLLESLK
jgi:hypothetical protein